MVMSTGAARCLAKKMKGCGQCVGHWPVCVCRARLGERGRKEGGMDGEERREKKRV